MEEWVLDVYSVRVYGIRYTLYWSMNFCYFTSHTRIVEYYTTSHKWQQSGVWSLDAVRQAREAGGGTLADQEVPEQSLLAQFFFRFHDLVFSLLRKNSIENFFLQFSSIYLSISKLLQFSLNFFNLFQFTSCSKFLSPIFSFFLTSHSCLTFNFVEKNLMNGSHPRQPTSSTVPL